MNGKERVIFSSYYNMEMYEETKKILFEELGEEKGWTCVDEVSDSLVWDEIELMNDINWDNIVEELDDFFSSSYFILQGEVGRWNGCKRGGYVIREFSDLCKAWNGCDYIKLYDVNGHFYVECSHHDGTNFYEVKELTDRGYDYIENHWYDSEEEVHNKVFNSSNYSRLPHYAHKVYGCKKREVM